MQENKKGPDVMKHSEVLG